MLVPMAGDADTDVAVLEKQLSESPGGEARLDLLLKLGDKLYYSAPKESEKYLRQLIDETRTANAPLLRGRALCMLAFLRYQVGKLDDSLALGSEALELARGAGIGEVEASAYNVLGTIVLQKGDFRKAIEYYEKCLQTSRAANYQGGIPTALSNLALCHFSLGQITKSLEYHQACLQLDRERQDWSGMAISFSNLGQCYEEIGDWEKALEYYYRSLAVAEQRDIKAMIAQNLSSLGVMYRKRGRPDRALELLRQASEITEYLDYASQGADLYCRLADVYLLRDDSLAARSALEKSRALAEALGDKEQLARIHRRWAEVLRLTGDPQGALAEIEAALRLCTAMGYEQEHGLALRGHAQVLTALNVPELAQASFEQSIVILSGGTIGVVSPGFSYELAVTRLAFAQFLVSRRNPLEALEQAQRAAELFRKLGIVYAAEEANRLIFSLRPISEAVQDRWLSLLHDLSGLAIWPAPASELARACLSQLTQGLRFQGGAFFFYGRQPYMIGRVALATLLGLPRQKELVLRADSVQIPVNYHGRNIGVLYLCEPDSSMPGPDPSFWEIIASVLTLIVERIRFRTSLDGAVALESGSTEPARIRPLGPEPALDARENRLRFGSIVWGSEVMKGLLDTVEKVAPTRATVLVRGESGAGKELVTRAIHELSPRHHKPLIVINCAALPETLLEAELFGIEKGVATGVNARVGKLELAEGGTVFLDEIGDMSLALQAKLLRVLQERTLERVGGRRTIPIDVRFVAATNWNLEAAVKAGRFREDLFHRLNVVTLIVPALRERKEEIPLLVEHFIRKYCEEYMRPIHALTDTAMDALLQYSWPGNVRELENAIERAVIVAREGLITREDLPAPLQARPDSGPEETDDAQGLKAMKRAARYEVSITMEKEYILRVLEQHNWQVPAVLRELNISKSHFYRLLKRYEIRRPKGHRGAEGT
jgi:transcriptional regulator with GAF, ATPase, and Fis domain/tetratricopeptide (TPR) repeat protein